MTKPFQDRIAVVTGASRGIGRAAALALAEAGAHVVAVARTQGALEELDDDIRAAGGSPATLVPLDVTDFEALDRLGLALYERWGRLDVFVGNAGVLGALTPLAHLDQKVWDQTMAVNVTANWRLLRSFDPLLRASDAGRAILVTSGAAHLGEAYWGPYAASKAALETIGRTYAAETAKTKIRVMMLNPGPLRTRMRASAFPGENAEKLRTPEDLAPEILRLASPDWTETGKIFDFPTGKVLTARAPE
jgi:NAD(P)-dependent dehydrogenase (short-subunit alcohol dehydrogenase family)